MVGGGVTKTSAVRMIFCCANFAPRLPHTNWMRTIEGFDHGWNKNSGCNSNGYDKG